MMQSCCLRHFLHGAITYVLLQVALEWSMGSESEESREQGYELAW
jgi:hypothetical protein